MSWASLANDHSCSTICSYVVCLKQLYLVCLDSICATSCKLTVLFSVSPSVYIGFTSLSAYDFCGNVGSVLTSTTVAFGPDELLSMGPPVLNTSDVFTETYAPISDGVTYPTTTVTSTELFYSPGPPLLINYADLGENCSAIDGYTYVPGNPSQFEIVSKFAFFY